MILYLDFVLRQADEKHLAVGMSSSLLSLRSRVTTKAQTAVAVTEKRVYTQAFRDFQSVRPQEEPVCKRALPC